MSTLEPATTAKVVIFTTKGDIEVELWAKEIPTVSKKFLQNCLDGKYNQRPFNTITQDLIQISAASVVYNERNEFHSRIRFNKKGLLGCVRENTDSAHNHTVDEFFITLKEMPSLNNQYIVFGKVTGSTIYNVVKIGDLEKGPDGHPLYPAIITNIEVLEKYFDIEPTKRKVEEEPKKVQKKAKVQLDYGEESDDQDFQIRSSHDVKRNKQEPKKNKSHKENEQKSDKSNEIDKKETEKKLNEETGTPSNVAEPKVKDGGSEAEVEQVSKVELKKVVTSKRSSRKTRRDPLLDQPYDPYLDLSSDEEAEQVLSAHKFLSKA